MAGNTFGTLFKLTTFGESHGPAIGGIIDGCPAGLKIDADIILHDLSRRRPGQSIITTQRNEPDDFEIFTSDSLVAILKENTTNLRLATVAIGLMTLLGAAIAFASLVLVAGFWMARSRATEEPRSDSAARYPWSRCSAKLRPFNPLIKAMR